MHASVLFGQFLESYFKSFIEIVQNITVPPLGESSEIIEEKKYDNDYKAR